MGSGKGSRPAEGKATPCGTPRSLAHGHFSPYPVLAVTERSSLRKDKDIEV